MSDFASAAASVGQWGAQAARSPYLYALLGGVALAFFELLKTFGRDVGAALGSKWAALLFTANAAAAMAAYYFVGPLVASGRPLTTALAVGATFPTLLRTRFTVFRAPAGKTGAKTPTEVALPMNEWYAQVQQLCLSEADIRLAARRRKVYKALMRVMSADQMEREIQQTLDALSRPEGRAEVSKQLQRIRAGDDAERHSKLVVLLTEVLPAADIRRLARDDGRGASP